MNSMNLVKLFWPHGGFSQKKWRYFFVNGCKMRILGSQLFICFINLAMRSQIGDIVRQMSRAGRYLMNLMNIYEVGIFKRFFEKAAWSFSEFMKWLCYPASCWFINWRIDGK